MRRFVVVGNGLAGHRMCLALRARDQASRIVLVGAEPGLPYDRPPLTKDFLLGSRTPESLTLKDAGSYRELDISYHPGSLIERIDRGGQHVHAADGRTFPYDTLVLATGSAPRQLDCVDRDAPVHYMRTIGDAVLLQAQLSLGRRVTIVGGGFIGLEVAAAASLLGCQVTVVEMGEGLLTRVMPSHFARFMLNLHRAKGVEVLLNAVVKGVRRAANGGSTVELSNGSFDTDVVVVGIGVLPNVALARDAGLAVENGIVVDEHCRTSDPAIFAVGEVTAHPVGAEGRRRRIEAWHVAAEQPAVAAATIFGEEAAFTDPPWFWTDQFGMNFQALGIPADGVRHLLRREVARSGWTLLCLDAERTLVGAIAANNGRDISALRRIMRAGVGDFSAFMKNARELPDNADIEL